MKEVYRKRRAKISMSFFVYWENYVANNRNNVNLQAIWVDIKGGKWHNHKGETNQNENHVQIRIECLTEIKIKNEIKSMTEIKIARRLVSKRKEEIATWKIKRQ